MSSTRLTWHLRAPRERVYRALTDACAIGRWRVPPGMRSEVHAFDVRVGGAIRVSLTYDDPDAAGKTGARADTWRRRRGVRPGVEVSLLHLQRNAAENPW